MKRPVRIFCQMEQYKIFDIIRESLGAIRNMVADCLVVPLLDEVFGLFHIIDEDDDQLSFSFSKSCKEEADSVRCEGISRKQYHFTQSMNFKNTTKQTTSFSCDINFLKVTVLT